MSKLRKILSYSILGFLFAFVLLGLTNRNVKADGGEGTNVMVDVSIFASIDAENPHTTLVDEKRAYGSNIEITSPAINDLSFAFWIVDGVVELSRPATTSFVATNDLDAIAVFKDATDLTIYMDHSGKLIKANYGGNTPPEDPDKIGYDFAEWQTETVDGVIIYRAVYTLTGAPVLINGKEYPYNSIVTLTAEEGKAWFDGDKRVSLNHELVLSAIDARTLVAQPADPITSLVTMRELIDFRTGHKTYITQVFGDVVEYGLELDGVLTKATNLHPTTDEFIISTPTDYSSVRAYAVIQDGTTFTTIFDREVEFVTNAEIVYDFSGFGSNGSAISDDAALYSILHNLDSTYLNSVSNTAAIYNGGGSGAPIQPGVLKMGTSSIDGQFTINLDYNVRIKNVVVHFTSWVDDVDKLTVNGTSESTYITNDRIIFELNDPTNIIEFTSQRRVVISKIELFGEDIEVLETDYVFVTYNYNDGETPNQDVMLISGSLITPPIPSRAGYDFNGWLLDDVLFDGQPVTTDITLIADWEELTIPYITDAGIVYDFIANSGTNVINATDMENLLDGFNNEHDVTVTTATQVYYGPSSIRLASSNNGGNLTLTFAQDVMISKIIIEVQRWASENGKTINVNGQSIPLTADKVKHEIDLSTPTNVIVLSNAGNNRAYVYSLELYGADYSFIDLEQESLSLGLAEGDKLDAITKDIILPTTGAYGSSITWESSRPELITSDGVVNRIDSNEQVTLTATITSGTETRTKEFIVTLAQVGLEDLEQALLDLEIGFADSNNEEAVTENLTLPNTINGLAVTWETSHPEIIAIVGTVTRPDEEATVTLIATVKYSDNLFDTKEFVVTVLAEGVEPEPEEKVILHSDFGKTDSNQTSYGNLYTDDVSNGSLDDNPNGSTSWERKGGNYNNTGWDFIKFGQKNVAAVKTNPNNFLSTNFSLDNITKIELILTSVKSGTEVVLQQSTDKTTWNDVETISVNSPGTVTFSNLESGSLYYRFVFVNSSSTSSNGWLLSLTNIIFTGLK